MVKPVIVSFFMKEAYPLFNPDCEGVFGGAEVDLFFLSTGLARDERCRVRFYVGDYGQPDRETRNGVELVKLRYSDLKKYPAWYHKLLRRQVIIRALFNDPADVVMTKTASDTLGYITIINKLIKGKKVLFKFGSDIDADIGVWKRRSRFIYYIYRFALRYVDRIICQTDTQQGRLDDRLRRKSCVIKNGFPLSGKDRAGLKEHILWVSRHDTMKRPELFVALARALPRERFLMVMPAGPRPDGALMNEISKTDNITFLERVSFSQMQAHFDRAKCFVNTSQFEGFPNTFIQACLGRTPILSFRVNPDHFIDQYGLGCCCRDDQGRAVEFIRSLNGEALQACGERAFRYAAEQHRLDEKVLQLKQLVFDLVRQ